MAETTTSTTTSQIDPELLPYLQAGLKRAQELFLTGTQPSFYEGQTYVSPSEATKSAIEQQLALAQETPTTLESAQAAYLSALEGFGKTASGEYLGQTEQQKAMLEAATRPLTQQFEQQTLPGIAGLYSSAGRYGSGAMERALGSASEQYARGLGDVSTNIVYQDYMRERQNQLQAQQGLATLAQMAPSIYAQQYLPIQQLASAGAAQEALEALPLQESMARYQFEQQLPYEQLSGYLSSVYGTPLGRYGTTSTTGQMPSYQNQTMNTLAGAGLGYVGGQALSSWLNPGSGFSLTSPTGYGLAGGALGGLLSFL